MAGPARPDDSMKSGYAYGIAAYVLWGVIPIYLKQLQIVPAIDIVAHRVAWSIPFLAVLILVTKGWAQYRAAFANPKTLGLLILSAGQWP